MTKAACRLLLWTTRVLGILVALFIGMFALDVFTEGRPLGETLAALSTLTTLDHPTWIPVIAGPLAVVGALFGLAWRHRAELHPRA